MILIAESGSSNTDWILWDEKTNQSSNFQSKGLNPFFVDSLDVADTMKSLFSNAELLAIDSIYFYGAGCGNNVSQETIKNGIEIVFPSAKIEVSHDLLAAARALCSTKPGIVCILGTGSNSCFYDGENIITESVSFGFMMGDEGSGNHMGRQLLKTIFTNKAPDNILKAFKLSYPHLNLSKFLNQLYHTSSPNRFLASFSPFIKAHHHDPFIRDLIENSFDKFCDFFIFDFIEKYDYPVHFVGSIAWNYKTELINRLKYHEINYGKIIKSPIEDLLKYHKERIKIQ